MSANFKCPSCNSYLNVEENIVLKIKNKENQQSLIVLSSKLGDYFSKANKSFELIEGEKYTFSCPICDNKLSDNEGNLAAIVMEEEDKSEHLILFSEIFGKQCTYKISDKKIESFGKDELEYIDFITLSYLT